MGFTNSQRCGAKFAEAWAEKCSNKLTADAEALLSDCLQLDPLEVINGILNVASKLTVARGATPEDWRDVAIDICLVACERFIRDTLAAEHIAAAAASDEMLIGASEQLAAAVIAAACCVNGVRLRFDEETRKRWRSTSCAACRRTNSILHTQGVRQGRTASDRQSTDLSPVRSGPALFATRH